MGKALKVIAPIAIGIGIGFATGGIGAGVGFSAATTSTGAAAGGGFFSGFGFNLSTLYKGLSALSSIAGGIAAKKQGNWRFNKRSSAQDWRGYRRYSWKQGWSRRAHDLEERQ
jgi:hypothetical protein